MNKREQRKIAVNLLQKPLLLFISATGIKANRQTEWLRFALMAVVMAFSLAALHFPEAQAESPKTSLLAKERESFHPYAKQKCILEMSPEELLQSYKEMLSTIEWSQSQNELQVILNRAGENAVSFMQSLMSTAASERVILERTVKERIGGQFVKSFRSGSFNYKYIILPQSDENKELVMEYRTDSKNRRVDRAAELNSFMVSTGYIGLCLYLHPKHQSHSTFRYLGRERGTSGAHIIAFAQKPECRDYLNQVIDVTTMDLTRFLVQGFVWLDPKAYQLARIRTTMLVAERDTSLLEQVTDAVYDDFAMKSDKDQKKQLRLPREISICWEFPRRFYRNRHRYTDYHIFAVSAAISFPPAK